MNLILSKQVFVFTFLVATLILTIITIPNSIGASDSSSASKSTTSSNNHHNHHHHSTATQSRASTAASVIGAIGSLVPGLITNVAPLVVLFGLGALMMPTLGMSAMGLLRESRRSSNDQAQLQNAQNAFPAAFSQYARPLQTSPQDIYYFTKRSLPSLMSGINTAGLMSGLQEMLERVARAIDNADKRYN